MISRIIKVSVRVISLRVRLISLTSTFIILDTYKEKKNEVMFLLLHWREATQSARTWDYPWPWVFLTWLLYNLQLWRQGADFENSLFSFGQSEKSYRVQCITTKFSRSRSRSSYYAERGSFNAVVLQTTAKICKKIKNARAQLLFCSLTFCLVTFPLSLPSWFTYVPYWYLETATSTEPLK